MYQVPVPGTGYRVQTDVVYSSLSSLVVPVSYEKNKMFFFFLIRSCLHELKNEVTNRGGKKTPFLNLKKNPQEIAII